MNHIVISDEEVGYPLNCFCIPRHYDNFLEKVLIPSGLINDRIERLAIDIVQSYNGEPFTAVCILKSSYKFFTDLLDKIKQYTRAAGEISSPISIDFIRLKSYVGTQSSETLEVIGMLEDVSVFDKNLLIVEDIIDTGFTLMQLLTMLKKMQPKSVKVVSLLLKRNLQSNVYKPDYIGFEVPDKFLVGYAMDYNEFFRDLNHVCVINEYGKKEFAVKT